MNALHLPSLPWIGHRAGSAPRRRFGPTTLSAIAAMAVAGFALLLTVGGGTVHVPDTALQMNLVPVSSIEIDPFAAEKQNAVIEELPAQF